MDARLGQGGNQGTMKRDEQLKMEWFLSTELWEKQKENDQELQKKFSARLRLQQQELHQERRRCAAGTSYESQTRYAKERGLRQDARSLSKERCCANRQDTRGSTRWRWT